MTVEQAAEYTHLSPVYIYELVRKKKIPYYKPKGRLYFKQDELEGFIFRNRVAADYEVSDMADAILNGEAK
jgi:excisionase family DNA binding protein